MMKFWIYWQRMIAQTPQLSEDHTKMTLTVAEFRRLQQRAYAQGFTDREPTEEAKANPQRPKLSRILESIFLASGQYRPFNN